MPSGNDSCSEERPAYSNQSSLSRQQSQYSSAWRGSRAVFRVTVLDLRSFRKCYTGKRTDNNSNLGRAVYAFNTKNDQPLLCQVEKQILTLHWVLYIGALSF